MTSWVTESLNEAQKCAVESVDGPVLVIAGPGSGKTRVITHRVAYLVLTIGINPRSILAVTFTNKAANEMKSRLQRLVGTRANQLTVGTFHALCASVLRRYGQHVGLDSSFAIFDDEDQMELLKVAMDQAEVDHKQFPRRTIQGVISRAKSHLMDAQELAAQVDSHFEEVAARAYTRYEELLGRNNAVDFDDLLLKTVHLFHSTPDVLKRYQERYVHLLIDEFQDTNLCQYDLVKLLSGLYHNVCVVGDPDQSIYSWRNADIRNILSFQKDYPTAKIINLAENYRSTATILNAAKGVISANRRRLENDIWTRKEAGSPIAVYEAFTEDEEAQYVIQRIDQLIRDDGVKRTDCAVMYRINAQSRSMEEACLRYGMKYRLVGGVRFYQRREVKDLIAYLRLINNPGDQVSLARIINTPPRGLGKRSLEQLGLWASSRNVSLYTALEQIHEGGSDTPPVTARAVQSIVNFVTLMQKLREESRHLDLVKLIDILLERIGYRSYLEVQDAFEDRWDNILELRSTARDFSNLDPGDGLTLLLERLALVADMDSYDEGADAITLITLHQAKGLEFPVVFITGMEEGLLPHYRSIDNPDQLEEERRLCYVGITRCMERLFLTRAFRRGLMFAGGPTTPSRFLQEIPPGLTAATKPLEESRTAWGRSEEPAFQKETVLTLKSGDKVTHAIFGEGVVISSAGEGPNQEATVGFKGDTGVKRLLLSYAPLEKAGGCRQ